MIAKSKRNKKSLRNNKWNRNYEDKRSLGGILRNRMSKTFSLWIIKKWMNESHKANWNKSILVNW